MSRSKFRHVAAVTDLFNETSSEIGSSACSGVAIIVSVKEGESRWGKCSSSSEDESSSWSALSDIGPPSAVMSIPGYMDNADFTEARPPPSLDGWIILGTYVRKTWFQIALTILPFSLVFILAARNKREEHTA
ncbi:transformation transcription domain-associated protein [Babesia ovis]|uniref:Transformation transcription domain-associated protein n=1 Tax=Babesia ovis TaxID=5869 RepID=A0A9W5TED7_BABOV|nr:transformation transcription domain-associated protein [Babesia ovis]